MAAHQSSSWDVRLARAPLSGANNLSSNGRTLAYASRGGAELLDDGGEGAPPVDGGERRGVPSGYDRASAVTAVRWVPTPGGWVMVVMTGDRDVFFYGDVESREQAANGAAQQPLLFSHTLSAGLAKDASVREADGATCAASVVCADGSCQICVGCNSGELLVVSCAGAGGFALESTLRAHASPLSTVSSDYHDSRGTRAGVASCSPSSPECGRAELATADVDGRLCLWSCPAGAGLVRRCTHTISRTDETSVGSDAKRALCCVSVCVRGPWIICGVATGEVMCLIADEEDPSRPSLRPLWCVIAHSRYLSCMDMHPFHDVLATAAEDGTVCIWQLHVPRERGRAGDARVLDVLHSSRWDNVMITGVSFSGDACDTVSLVGYDERAMKVIKWA